MSLIRVTHSLLRFSRDQGCLYLRIPRNRWLVVHWWTKAVR